MRRPRNRRFYGEVGLLVLILTLIIFTIVVDVWDVKLARVLLIKSNNIEDFLNTLFTVQASISTIGIAIIALVSDKTKDTVYGVTISKFVMQDNHYIFKHKFLIIGSLVFTIFNFVALSFQYYNVLLALFSGMFLFSISFLLLLF